MLNRPPLSMIDSGQTKGKVVATGRELKVEVDDPTLATEFKGHYDHIMGTMTLSVPGFPVVKFRGFLTNRDLKHGREGQEGEGGKDGVTGLDGIDGQHGHRGCLGPEGPRGRPGQRGPRGQRGPEGGSGNKGTQGERGEPGEMMVYFQKEDPGAVGAGALWVKI